MTKMPPLPGVPVEFNPRRAASWWCSLDDLLWPDARIARKIEQRARGFAGAGIDTAIFFGFHTRFDFSDHFGALHGYLAAVCRELHGHGIRVMDHFSCNLVERPRGEAEWRKLHRGQRHHILLYPDEQAAAHAQYEGHLFRDLCEVDIRDGSRGYSWTYQTELFCHNNPGFLDMHRRYLQRLVREVPVDGLGVDDMCDYGGLATCACRHCRERFRRDYGHELPPFEDKSFWGDTSGPALRWGNYANPAFRDWVRMRADSVADHVRMVKDTVGDRLLMTCCSNTGPMFLNAVSLNLERMAEPLDILMLENVGITADTVDWARMDAEALMQKAIAAAHDGLHAIALSYTIYRDGGYLGWSLARYWGVANWCSTLIGRLAEDPPDALEDHEIISRWNNWERRCSELDFHGASDVAEVRLVNNRHCRDNGWRDEAGREHWDRVAAWSRALVEENVGYRFLLAEELGDADALRRESTPLILDGAGCVSDRQFHAVKALLENGGQVWLNGPFGSHDEKGFPRPHAFGDELLAGNYAGLTRLDAAVPAEALDALVGKGSFCPRVRQLAGDPTWALRFRLHQGRVVLHCLNRALEAIPHPTLREANGPRPILHEFKATNSSLAAEYEVDFTGLGQPWPAAELLSPEFDSERREVRIAPVDRTKIRIQVPLVGIRLYATVQSVDF